MVAVVRGYRFLLGSRFGQKRPICCNRKPIGFLFEIIRSRPHQKASHGFRQIKKVFLDIRLLIHLRQVKPGVLDRIENPELQNEAGIHSKKCLLLHKRHRWYRSNSGSKPSSLQYRSFLLVRSKHQGLASPPRRYRLTEGLLMLF